MSSRRALALLLVCLISLAVCSGGSASSSTGSHPSSARSTSGASGSAQTSSLRWHGCSDGECATLSVPLDYAAPQGKQIKLALSRVRAAKPSRRVGSLLVNPGVPGAPGTGFASEVASQLPDTISDRFDVVGWDPRGTGKSSPVDCGTHLDYLFTPGTSPEVPGHQPAADAAAKRFAQSCESRSGDLLAHISSMDTARDMDRIRQALGEPKLTYAGFSYGTYLGALYARMFPQNVRALVLDGAVDPAVPVDEVSIQQARAFDGSLDAFLADCASNHRCTFHHDGHPRAALDALRAKITAHPMRGSGGVLGPTQFSIALAAPLYVGVDGYSMLATALASVEDGDPGPMLELFDGYVDRDAGGTYTAEWSAFLATSCADGPDLTASAMTDLQAKAAAASPYFGATTVALGLTCSFWPVPPATSVAGPIAAPGAPPIVVIGTTGDPATPVSWADGLAAQLGSGRLVTVDGTSHTSLLAGNPCLDAAASSYLIHLRAPVSGLHCGDER